MEGSGGELGLESFYWGQEVGAARYGRHDLEDSGLTNVRRLYLGKTRGGGKFD